MKYVKDVKNAFKGLRKSHSDGLVPKEEKKTKELHKERSVDLLQNTEVPCKETNPKEEVLYRSLSSDTIPKKKELTREESSKFSTVHEKPEEVKKPQISFIFPKDIELPKKEENLRNQQDEHKIYKLDARSSISFPKEDKEDKMAEVIRELDELSLLLKDNDKSIDKAIEELTAMLDKVITPSNSISEDTTTPSSSYIGQLIEDLKVEDQNFKLASEN